MVPITVFFKKKIKIKTLCFLSKAQTNKQIHVFFFFYLKTTKSHHECV